MSELSLSPSDIDNSTPMTVRCRFCREEILLNVDNQETREAGTDPHQQIRKHLLKHAALLPAFVRDIGFLIDMLAFDSPNAPTRWRIDILHLVDHYLRTSIR